ncbi:MAG: 30S ribosomal protein S9, partial [Rhodospirillaceae bacterium]
MADLGDLKDLVAGGDIATTTEAAAPEVAAPKLDAQGRAYATGKRKNAIARVWLKPGSGKVTVNGRDIEVYFARPVLRMIINQPFKVCDREGQFDVFCTVVGGGLSGQAGAVRHGISKGLNLFEPGLRPELKKNGFLTR